MRLAAGPSAFPAEVLDAVAARTGCRVQIVPPLAAGAAPAAGIDLVELRGDAAGALVASGRLALIEESTVPGLSEVPGRLRDVVRDAGGGLRAVPYLWSPQLLLARRAVYGARPPTSLRALFSLRGAARAALPDSPLELAVAARYLGVGNPFALDRDELVAARGVVAPARPLLHLYRDAAELRALFRRGAIDLALGNPATLGDQRGTSSRACRARARSRPSGCSASSPGRGARSARGASRAACSRLPPRRGWPPLRGLTPVRTATCSALSENACQALQRALSRTLANSAMAIHPAASEGVTGWPEWVGEWVSCC